MFKNEEIVTLRILTILIGTAALFASIAGIVDPAIYKPVVSDKNMPFVFAQDLISFAAAVSLFLIAIFSKSASIKANILQTGVIGYLFYGYGMYVIGTLYNYFYFLYLSVFGLSIFYLIIAFAGIEYRRLEFTIDKSLRLTLATYCGVMPILFAPQWIIALLRLIRIGARPDGVFSFFPAVFILDLCFVLPVCAVAAASLFRKRILGFLLGGIISIKGFTLLVSVALGYLFQPVFLQKLDRGNALLYTIVSLVFLVLSVFYFTRTEITKITKKTPDPGIQGPTL